MQIEERGRGKSQTYEPATCHWPLVTVFWWAWVELNYRPSRSYRDALANSSIQARLFILLICRSRRLASERVENSSL